MIKNLLANARDMGLIPGLGRCPGGGYGNLLQYSCLGNPMDRGAWGATVHRGHRELDMTEQTQVYFWALGSFSIGAHVCFYASTPLF